VKQVPQFAVSFDRVIPSDLSLLDGAVAEITSAIDRAVWCEDIERIGLAVRRAIAKAIVHRNQYDPARALRASVSVNDDDALLVVVRVFGSDYQGAGKSAVFSPLRGTCLDRVRRPSRQNTQAAEPDPGRSADIAARKPIAARR